MIRVRFTKFYAPYNVGEVASYEKDQAAKLVKAGLADYADPVVVPVKKVITPVVTQPVEAPVVEQPSRARRFRNFTK